jgi:hypothetical protein
MFLAILPEVKSRLRRIALNLFLRRWSNG